MNPRDERGVVLATCLVFLFVLSLASFSGAFLARTDIAIVRSLGDGSRAFYVAEAGVAEALLRLTMRPGAQTHSRGAGPFDPAIVPDPTDPHWRAIVLDGMSTPQRRGSITETPTIQPPGAELDYLTTVDSAAALSVAWSLDAGGLIRSDPSGAPILELVATGRDGIATRRITRSLVRQVGNGHVILETSDAVCPTAEIKGAALVVTGDFSVNGACNRKSGALYVDNGRLRSTGRIGVVGTVSRKGRTDFTPSPIEGIAALPDPHGSLPLPDISALPVRNGLPGRPLPLVLLGATTLRPGVYYGGIVAAGTADVRFEPGLYVLAGGGLTVTGQASVQGAGVTLYVTGSGAGLDIGFGRVTFDDSSSVDLSASTTGTYAGFLLFQDRRNDSTIRIAGNGSKLRRRIELSGILYAAAGHFEVEDDPQTLAATVVVRSLLIETDLSLTPPPPGWLTIAWHDF